MLYSQDQIYSPYRSSRDRIVRHRNVGMRGKIDHSPRSRFVSLYLSLLALAAALLSACVFTRSWRRHLFTSSLALLQPPVALNRNPLAWHSSRAAMTSAHA